MRAARHGSGGVLALTIAAVLIGWATPPTANAQCPGWLPTNDEGLPGPDGKVNTSVAWDPDGDGPEPEWLVVAGQFDYVGLERANNIAAWDGDQWRTLGGGTNGTVFTLAVHDGKLFAGGLFTTAGGVEVNRVARWDGTRWQALGMGITNGTVASMCSHTDGLYVAGPFSQVEGQVAAPVARWDGAMWHPLPRTFPVPNNVSAVAVFGGEIYVGGRFRIRGPDGQFITDIARWDGTRWVRVGEGLNGWVNELTVHEGKLFAGADSSFAVGTPGISMGGVASWDGASWSFVGSNPLNVGSVRDFEVVNGVLHVVTAFAVSRLVDDTWELLTTGIALSSVTSFRSTFALAGSFSSIDGLPARGVAIRQGDSWDTPGYPVVNLFQGVIGALKEIDGDLIVGGSFSAVDGKPANDLARWNGQSWTPIPNNLQPSPVLGGPYLSAVEHYLGDLIVAGVFIMPGDPQSSFNIARWDGAQWHGLGSGLGTSGFDSVSELAVYRGELYAMGSFARAGGITVSNIARWNGSSWSRVARAGTSTTGLFSSLEGMYALAVAHDSLYIGGYRLAVAPPQALGPPSTSIFRWDGNTYNFVPTPPSSAGTINALVVFGNDLIAGGSFTSIHDVPARNIARWDGSAWHPLGDGVSGGVSALTEYQGSLIVAGRFDSAGGVSAQNIARWDGASWQPMGSGTVGNAYSLSEFRGELIAAGGIAGAGGMNAVTFARWSDTGVPPIISHPADTTADVSGSATFSVSLSPGYDLAGDLRYQWRRHSVEIADGPGGASPGGGEVSGATSSMLTLTNAQPADAGAYDCVITNDCGEAVSATATLTVLNGACPWDVNLDGTVGLMDLGAVLGAWGSTSPPAPGALDLDGSGVIDLGDVAALMAHWGAACP